MDNTEYTVNVRASQGTTSYTMDTLSVNKSVTIDKTGYYYGLGMYDIAITNQSMSYQAIDISNGTGSIGSVTIGPQVPYVEVKLNNETFLYVDDVDNQISQYGTYQCCKYVNAVGRGLDYVPIYFKEGDIISFRCVLPSVNITWGNTNSYVTRILPSIGYVARLVES